MNVVEYRGHWIKTVWNGWKITYPGGAQSPETYRNLDDAKRSVDFDLKNERKAK